jgi:hypothetical protein
MLWQVNIKNISLMYDSADLFGFPCNAASIEILTAESTKLLPDCWFRAASSSVNSILLFSDGCLP